MHRAEIHCRRVEQHYQQKKYCSERRIEDVVHALGIDCHKAHHYGTNGQHSAHTAEKPAVAKKPNLPPARIRDKEGGYSKPRYKAGKHFCPE